MAIDYGKKRTGLAVSDPAQIIAQGLITVETPNLLLFLTDYFGREPVERVIIGRPLQNSGDDSENAGRVDAFITRFRKSFPQIPIETTDERFTSVLAHRAMIDGGLKKQARQNKALVDEISATIILQSYMESRRA
jgi:putative Holliday junction resolvase